MASPQVDEQVSVKTKYGALHSYSSAETRAFTNFVNETLGPSASDLNVLFINFIRFIE
jgi:hypothetical protein